MFFGQNNSGSFRRNACFQVLFLSPIPSPLPLGERIEVRGVRILAKYAQTSIHHSRRQPYPSPHPVSSKIIILRYTTPGAPSSVTTNGWLLGWMTYLDCQIRAFTRRIGRLIF